MASICRSIQSELVLIYCDVDINEVNIYCCIHTLLLASRRYVYNFRFLFVSRLEPLLFFINSITFQFVWRDVDVFFFFFFFLFFFIFFQFSILKLKYVYYTCFIVLKPQPAAAENRQKQQQHQLEAFVDVINRLKNWRYSKSAFTFSLWRFFSPRLLLH